VQGSRKFQSITTRWARLWGVPSVAKVEIVVNARLRTCLGRCFPKLNRIELNPSLFRTRRKRLNEVLCHEAAHMAAYILRPHQARAHGKEWATLMLAAGFKPETMITLGKCMPRPGREEFADLFQHSCPICRFTRFARRPVSRWKCRTCILAGLSGTLKVRRIRREERDGLG
jgi:predicted SprT family Zn-dependent metalloprotease